MVARNILVTYVPAVCICVLIGVLLDLDTAKPSPTECWRTLNDPGLLDYLIYVAAFILPNLIAAVINVVYLCRYSRSEYTVWNKFMLFPIVQVFSAAYYVATKTYLMFAGSTAFQYSEVLYLCEPLLYGILFFGLVASRLQSDSSDTTSIISDRLRAASTDYY